MKQLARLAIIVLAVILAACSNPTTQAPENITSMPKPTSAIGDGNYTALTPAQNQAETQEAPMPIVEVQLEIPSDPAEAALGEAMKSYLEGITRQGQFMGSVLVAKDGKALLFDGFGMADLEANIANTPDHQYRIGSLTKQFTAAAILKLQESGLLGVQDPVQKYLPAYPRGDEITIHNLLTHTSGIPNYEQRPDLPQVVQSPISLDDLIASFADQPLDFPPGQQYRYSSSGYVLLTKIIEVVSGQSYSDYLQEHIFAPAGMNDSGYDFLDPAVPNPATGYFLTQRGPQRAFLTDSSWPTGAGALYSTLNDLYLWDRVLYSNRVLSAESLEAMFTPWVNTGQGTDYGYGWDIGSTLGRSSIAHGGGIFGFASYMLRFPQNDAVIIVLSNGIQMPPRVVAEELARILFSS